MTNAPRFGGLAIWVGVSVVGYLVFGASEESAFCCWFGFLAGMIWVQNTSRGAKP